MRRLERAEKGGVLFHPLLLWADHDEVHDAHEDNEEDQARNWVSRTGRTSSTARDADRLAQATGPATS